jgi:acetoin utilization deacetylase AcuC-like enzyme
LPGRASLNLMKMAKPGLGFELRNIVHKARKTGEPVKKEGLEITAGAKTHRVSIEALPLKTGTEDNYFLVVFEETKAPYDEAAQAQSKTKG